MKPLYKMGEVIEMNIEGLIVSCLVIDIIPYNKLIKENNINILMIYGDNPIGKGYAAGTLFLPETNETNKEYAHSIIPISHLNSKFKTSAYKLLIGDQQAWIYYPMQDIDENLPFSLTIWFADKLVKFLKWSGMN